MMPTARSSEPENTAARVALWRALHVQADAPPHVLEDEVRLTLVGPADGWKNRPDVSPFTAPFRASIVARARFVEEAVAEAVARGLGQYVILGAGLDTFAQRRANLTHRLTVFEIDQPGPQAWKRERLIALGLGVPSFLRLVPVDFEAGDDWWARLAAAGFDAGKPALVASTGVSMYLTEDAIRAMLHRVASLAPGSSLILSFMLPIELATPSSALPSSAPPPERTRTALRSSASSHRPPCWRSRGTPASSTSSTSRRPRSPNATSRTALMAASAQQFGRATGCEHVRSSA